MREANIEGERGSINVSSSQKEKGKEKEKEKEKGNRERIMGWKNSSKREVIEEIALVMGLVSVQFLMAGNAILLSIILKTGIQPSSLIICSTFATFLVLSPLAILFERQIN